MRTALQLRPLTQDEFRVLNDGLQSDQTYVVRRCQILLASARGDSVDQIHRTLGSSRQGIRDVLHLFNDEGLKALMRRSNRPKSGPKARPTLAEHEREQIRCILDQSPSSFGKSNSSWTLTLLAQVVHEQGLSSEKLSLETVRIALKRMNINWKQFKNQVT